MALTPIEAQVMRALTAELRTAKNAVRTLSRRAGGLEPAPVARDTCCLCGYETLKGSRYCHAHQWAAK